ncbi:MAG: hypothetical protein WEA99_00575 [Brumimicrobium sp.]
MKISEDKILVFDADVLIHFIKSGSFSELRKILPNNKKVVLQKVYEEVQVFKSSKQILDSAIHVFKFIDLIDFPISTDMMREFAYLTSPLMDIGKGESACMSYCKFTDDVVVSSNLSDVNEYCKRHTIDLLTTMDLVLWAFEEGLWSEEYCDTFITVVLKKGGRLPCKSIKEYQDKKSRS